MYESMLNFPDGLFGQFEAKLKDGVLRLRIPKAAHAQPRRIEVTAG